MSRLAVVVLVGAILCATVVFLPQTVGQEKSTGKASDEIKDSLKRIADLEKKLVEQNRAIRILQAEAKERAFFDGERDRRERELEKERQILLNKEVKPLTARQKARFTLEALQQPIDTKPLQEKVKLAIALDYLGDQTGFKLPFVLDRDSFVAELGADALDLYEEEVSLVSSLSGPSQKISMETVLHRLLAQVGKGQATHVIRSNQIKITTLKASLANHAIHQATVTLDFDQRPFGQALQHLSDDSGIDIHLDPNVGRSADTLITATFRNSSVDNALVTITEMANLKYVVLQRSVFVTTAERAKVLRQEVQERSKQREIIENSSKGKRAEAVP